jgi:hypothetical protein
VRRAPALLVVLVVAACGGGSRAVASGTSATTAPAPKPRLHAVITAQSHHPKIGHAWTYRVRVTGKGGKPVACRIHLQFTFGGIAVGEVGKHVLKKGFWKETIPATGPDAFPLTAVGQPLVLRVIATAKGYRPATAGWKVQVVR